MKLLPGHKCGPPVPFALTVRGEIMLSEHLPHKAPDVPPGEECAGSGGLQFVVTVALQGGRGAQERPTVLLELLEVVTISNSATKSKGRFWKQLEPRLGLVML